MEHMYSPILNQPNHGEKELMVQVIGNINEIKRDFNTQYGNDKSIYANADVVTLLHPL